MGTKMNYEQIRLRPKNSKSIKVTNKELLKKYRNIADKHEKRIRDALELLKFFMPLTVENIENFDTQTMGFLELATNRFVKLQDLINTKIFPLIIEMLSEDTPYQSMIDKFNILEKLGYLPSADDWRDLCDTSRITLYEYLESEQEAVDKLNKILNAAQILVDYWKDLRVKLDGVIEKAK